MSVINHDRKYILLCLVQDKNEVSSSYYKDLRGKGTTLAHEMFKKDNLSDLIQEQTYYVTGIHSKSIW